MSQAHGLPALALSLSCVTASESQSLLQPQCPHPKSGDWNTLRGGDDLCKHWVSARHTENSRTVSSPRCRCLSRAPALQPQVREDSGSEQPSLAPPNVEAISPHHKEAGLQTAPGLPTPRSTAAFLACQQSPTCREPGHHPGLFENLGTGSIAAASD